MIRLRERLSEQTEKEVPALLEGDSSPSSGSDTFRAMLAYIQTHYQEKIKLKDVAQQFYLHPGYCSVLFSKNLGVSFPEYLTSIRIKKACELLRNTNLSVNEIAQKVGVDDYFYFNKIFKKRCNITPNEYRKKQQGK